VAERRVVSELRECGVRVKLPRYVFKALTQATLSKHTFPIMLYTQIFNVLT
jgi:hypothetical protein